MIVLNVPIFPNSPNWCATAISQYLFKYSRIEAGLHAVMESILPRHVSETKLLQE